MYRTCPYLLWLNYKGDYLSSEGSELPDRQVGKDQKLHVYVRTMYVARYVEQKSCKSMYTTNRVLKYFDFG